MDIGCSNSPCLDCMESFTTKCDFSTTTLCNHVFHTDCVAKWLQSDKCVFPQSKKPCTYNQFVKTFFFGLEEKSRKFKDGNGEALYHWLIENNPKSVDGTTLLHWAAGDHKRWTPLHEQDQNTYLDICTMILNSSVDINPKDHEGWTPLHKAAQFRSIEIFEMILDKTVDKNPEDNKGWTPLHAAAQN